MAKPVLRAKYIITEEPVLDLRRGLARRSSTLGIGQAMAEIAPLTGNL